ncbi:hypothetical protein GCM10010978_26250 [Compostibacillus humi]|uniref:ParB/Sulfiredoxin domain-containing protein n=1 Tax=Compostibacillus humi TaxID=1245525 RepID=A0A8J2X9V1_9BACI|nr:hypothetical protein [Compostibacillus humi]GFZ84663.1 hypothetical protein GCM10010978_26250 [Compostibacillus humi]
MTYFERPIHKEMYAKDLTLSKTNPRFPHPVKSEKEAILTFFQLKKVGPKKIEQIIQDIFETKVVLEDFIVLKENERYVVYDGNRRLTALKLFLGNNSEIIKDKYKRTYELIKTLKEEYNISTIPLSVKVYTDKNSMANHVLKIHSGQQGGVGQIPWDSNEKDSFKARHLNQPLSLGNKIYKKLQNSPDLKDLYNKIKNEAYTTTFDRIFSFLDIRTRIFKLEYGRHVDVDNEIHFNKICEMIEFFIAKNANVGDVYTKQKAISFFESIDPIEDINDNIKSKTFETTKVITKKTDIQGTNANSGRNLDDNTSKTNNSTVNGHDIGTSITGSNTNIGTTISIGRNPGGRPRKKPSEYNSLIEAYYFKNKFRKNDRINGIMDEIKHLQYKDFGLSVNFLIRSLLETYAYEYVKVFSSLEKDNPNRLKGLTVKNFSDKELSEKYFDYIANHIGKLENGKYSTIGKQILTYFNKNNNIAITQKLNHYVHIPDFIPTSTENLETWSVVYKILHAMDNIIESYTGQDY